MWRRWSWSTGTLLASEGGWSRLCRRWWLNLDLLRFQLIFATSRSLWWSWLWVKESTRLCLGCKKGYKLLFDRRCPLGAQTGPLLWGLLVWQDRLWKIKQHFCVICKYMQKIVSNFDQLILEPSGKISLISKFKVRKRFCFSTNWTEIFILLIEYFIVF